MNIVTDTGNLMEIVPSCGGDFVWERQTLSTI